jgi:SAM-dependent methyltransferase
MAHSELQQAVLNQAVFQDAHAVRGYRAASGFSDRGEQAMYEVVRARVRDEAILDIGVGGGRTVLLLEPLARRYVALDYAPRMVEACRARFPNVDVSVGDARDLSRFADASFGLVTFSFNGIDAVDHESRKAVLREVGRVLRPQGLFWFSTLNIAGLGLRLRPWLPEWPERDGRPLRRAYKTARMLARMPKRVLNYARLRPLFEEGRGWSINTLSAHDYNLLVHYTTFARERDELAEHGFEIEQALDSDRGEPLAMDSETRDAFWFQILARKSGS